MSLVPIHHHAKISQYDLLHSTCCAFHPLDSFIFYLEVYSSYSPSAVYAHPPHPLPCPLAITCYLYLCFCCSVYFLDLFHWLHLYVKLQENCLSLSYLFYLARYCSIPLYIDLPHLLYPFINDGHFGCFHIFIFVKKKCCNEHRHSYISWI